jgi:hypothetical protein
MFRFVLLAFLLHLLLPHSVHSQFPDGPFPWFLQGSIKSMGGEEQFRLEMVKVLEHASTLRGGLNCHFQRFKDARNNFVVGRLLFEDGIAWCAKIAPVGAKWKYIEGMQHAVKSLEAIEEYCPQIPAPRVHGFTLWKPEARLDYYFTDWINGSSIAAQIGIVEVPTAPIVENGLNTSCFEANYTVLSEDVLKQMGAFFYNLTTCPIPSDTCIPFLIRN